MKRSYQKGAALILAMIFLFVLSVMAVSMMFLSQSETWASMNYRLLTQARYGAEAGLNQAANYLVYSYTPPGGPADPISAYDITKSPVTLVGGAQVVGLSSISGASLTYPVSSVQNAFNTATQGSVTAGNVGVSYVASATLLSMRQVTVYGSATPQTIQTWQITADGNITGVRNAQVEVSAIMEREITPMFNYAVFGTFNGCSALSFGGGAKTDSYNSSNIQTNMSGNVITQQYGGNIGANGNLHENGGTTTIYGSMSTPRTGVGSCSSGNQDAWTNSGGAQVTGGLVKLAQPVTYPTPTIPSPGSTDLSLNNADCSSTPGCSGKKGTYTLAPGSYGNISLNGGATLTLTAGTYNINSLALAGNSTVVVNPGIPPGPVILNVTGNSQTTVVDFTGGNLTNSSLNPGNLQINYAGSGTINLKGGANASGLVNAPNATISFGSSKGDWYGAVIGQYVNDTGGTSIHYDRQLKNEFFTVGNFMLNSFSWSKF